MPQRYKTGNPRPSNSMKDLNDNALAYDDFINSDADHALDRFDRVRRTWVGMERHFDRLMNGFNSVFDALIIYFKGKAYDAISAIGWQELGNWVVNITLINRQQVVWHDNAWYKFIGALPHTITGGSPGEDGGIWSKDNPSGLWVNIGDASVRCDLAKGDGLKYIGRCPDIATLRTIVPEFTSQKIDVISYYEGWAATQNGAVGGGFFTSVNDATTSDDGGIFIRVNSSTGWRRVVENSVLVTHFGGRGNDSDETAIIQRAINSVALNKIKLVIDSGFSFSAHGIVIDSRHNGIRIDGDGWIKFYGNGGTQQNKPSNIVTGADYCIYVNGVSNAELSLQVDGNSASKLDNEQIHSIGMFGGKNISMSKLRFKNTRGDGLYITQSNGNVESAIPENVNIDFIESINETFDGRNAISVISVNGLNITTMVSLRHGGIVGGVYQPGGLDIEPNYYFQKCYNITVKSYRALCAGSQGLTIAGKQATGDFGEFCVKNVHFDNVDVEMTDIGRNRADVVLINGVNDVFVRGFAKTTALYTGDYVGLHVVGATGVDANITTRRCKHAAWLGYTPVLGLRNTYSSRFIINADRYHDGVSIGWADGFTVDFIGINPTQMGTGDMGHLQYIANPGESTPIRRTKVSVRTSGYEGFLERLDYGIRVNPSQTPAIYKGTNYIIDSDLTNVLHNPASGKNRMQGTKDIVKTNIDGVTPYPGTPISGTDIWGDGDIVFDTNASTSKVVGRVYTSTGFQVFSQLP
ncbi:hypothetical protein KGP26_07670 [Serratia sp. JSRIV002]|uniref:hypothetical protein n=1 Tax=Serratia sp. JSRIV002 TaxID=2831894 RepID=UPI001CBD2F2E|nr:hypothetical protein [Serratia sp. JSRIV002]UAN54457.1 hypothetical protein KGP26_07670 [Serratia sp. JSRIV002]